MSDIRARRSHRGVAVGGAVLAAVCGVDAVGAQPITGGAPSAGDGAVVALVERAPQCSAGPTLLCTGTLIAPRAVLTAAHCVVDTAPSAIAVVAGSNVAGGGEPIAVTDIFVHPDYPDASDIAVVALGASPPDAPLPIRRAPLDVAHVGADVRIVGYGADDDGVAGIKRTGVARVSNVTGGTFTIEPGPAMSCGGDSGGPVLLADGADPEHVAGVTAFGDPACAVSGTNTRVDAHAASFVDPTLAAIAATPPPPERSGIDPSVDYCAEPCAAPADCPTATECVDGRCALLGGDVGRFERGCEACEAGACLAGLVDDACVCFTPCPPAEPDCGCRAGAGADGSWLVLVCIWVAARRRR